MKLAPYDPNPTVNSFGIAGKEYHWTWSKKLRLTLHRGVDSKCRRVHYHKNGNKA